MTTVWARKGSRPTAVRQTEYDYLWVIGAVCPETGQAEGLLSPRLNTDVINVFLEQFAATLMEDEHAVMIWDGAGFHTSKRLQIPHNITLIQLPPYSPELNPIENLWHYLKSHYWSNRTYEDCDERLNRQQSTLGIWLCSMPASSPPLVLIARDIADMRRVLYQPLFWYAAWPW